MGRREKASTWTVKATQSVMTQIKDGHRKSSTNDFRNTCNSTYQHQKNFLAWTRDITSPFPTNDEMPSDFFFLTTTQQLALVSGSKLQRRWIREG